MRLPLLTRPALSPPTPPHQLKTGDPRAAAAAGAELTAGTHPPEVAHFGYSLLTCVAGERWGELDDGARGALASLALDRATAAHPAGGSGPTTPYAVRSKAAILLAVVAKAQGPAAWAAIAERLLAAGSAPGAPPAAAEAAAAVLKSVAEEVVSFPGAYDRAMLAALAASAPACLAFVRAALGAHAPAALAGDPAAAAAARGALAAALALSDWAPLGAFHGAGVLAAAGELLTCRDADLRLSAADVLRALVARRQAQEDADAYGAAMAAAGAALAAAAGALLAAPGAAAALDAGGELGDYGLRFADAAATWMAAHAARLPPDARAPLTSALLALSGHKHIALASRALAAWPPLLAATAAAGGSDRTAPLPPDAAAALLELAADGLARAAVAAADADAAVADGPNAPPIPPRL